MFEDFKEKLRVELASDLPGELAHSMMMPTVRDDNMRMPVGLPPPMKSAVLSCFIRMSMAI